MKTLVFWCVIALLFEFSTQTPERCMMDIAAMTNMGDITNALMIDYTGKAVNDLGNYDGCQWLDSSKAHYCVAQTLVPINVAHESLPVFVGLCVPPSCDEESLLKVFKLVLDKYNIPLRFNLTVEEKTLEVHCIPREPPKLTAGAIITICICSVLAFLIVAGTLLEFYDDYVSYPTRSYADVNSVRVTKGEFAGPEVEEKQSLLAYENTQKSAQESGLINADHPTTTRASNTNGSNKGLQRNLGRHPIISIAKCWGLKSNIRYLLVDNRGGEWSLLSPLNGLRTIMMAWVILGHTMTYMTYPVGFDNLEVLQKDVIRRVSFQVIPGAELAVDVFFYLSGFLVVFMLLKEMKQKKDRIPWGLFYFHRYWRLTPVYAFIILVYTTLTPYMIRGPFEYLYRGLKTEHCTQYWWTNLLYINNFYPTSSNSQCLGWSWYLANDMQFYIITPLFAIVYRRRKRLAYAMVLAIIAACVLINGLLAWKNNLINTLDPNNDQFNSIIYNKPYTRIGPYLVGVIVAYLLQEEDLDLASHPVIRWVGYAVAATTTTCATYLTYHFWIEGWSLTESVFYVSFARLGFAIGVGWTMYAFHKGHGGLLKQLMSMYIWVPLARLTYTAYLTHPAIMFVINFNNTTTFHYTAIYVAIRYAAHLVLAYSVGFAFHVAVEKPTSNFERILLPKRNH